MKARLQDTETFSRFNSMRLIPLGFFFVGAIALSLSILYSLTIPAFIGLGLIFWGAILFYTRSDEYIKRILLHTTVLPSLFNLNQIIMELGYEGGAVYLPSKYFDNFESTRVYISLQNDQKLPRFERIQNEESKVFVKNPACMLMTPPGIELTRLFEKALNVNFAKVDLNYIEKAMPNLLIKDLEICQNVIIERNNNRIHVKIEHSNYQKVCSEVKKFSKIHGSLGCPFCSSIACILVEAIGCPIAIEKEEPNLDAKTITLDLIVFGGSECSSH
jgi:hypothetical protein